MRVSLSDPTAEQITEATNELIGEHSITDLSRGLDTSRETIYRWKRGDSLPSLIDLLALSRITNSSVIIRLNVTDEGDTVQELQEAVMSLFADRSIVHELLALLAQGHGPEDVRVTELVERLIGNTTRLTAILLPDTLPAGGTRSGLR